MPTFCIRTSTKPETRIQPALYIMAAKKVILWSAPRCVSTAFERSIRTLHQAEVFHELFAIPYHCGLQRDSELFTEIPFDANATYQSVADILTKTYDGKRLVFAKEMACCLKRNYAILLPEKMREFQHTFLIRNPYHIAQSLISCGYFVSNEFGIKELYELYNFVENQIHPSPLIIDADDLLEFPDEVMRAYCEAIEVEHEGGMTSWQPGPVPGWDRHVCAGWHDSVMESNGFVKRPRKTEKTVYRDLPKEALDVIEECLPLYESMYAKRMIINKDSP